MERDKFMTPLEAKEFGIIDKVLEHPLQEREEQMLTNLNRDKANTTTTTL